MTPNTTNDLRSQAILVSLRVTSWSARKYDKKVTAEVNDKHGAAADAGRYNKHLLPGDVPTYKALVSLLNSARTKHYIQTLPWGDEYKRLLPIANNMAYRNMMAEIQSELVTLRDAFIADYPDLRRQAQVMLNGMWNKEDYPAANDLRTRFTISADYDPVPKPSEWPAGLAAAVRSSMDNDLNDRVRRATQAAMQDAWQRLYDCIQHLHERLATPGAIFRDSLVENVRECCDVLTRLNVTNDADLERLRAQTASSLAVYSADDLRSDDRTRGKVARNANQLMTAILGTRRIVIPGSSRAA